MIISLPFWLVTINKYDKPEGGQWGQHWWPFVTLSFDVYACICAINWKCSFNTFLPSHRARHSLVTEHGTRRQQEAVSDERRDHSDVTANEPHLWTHGPGGRQPQWEAPLTSIKGFITVYPAFPFCGSHGSHWGWITLCSYLETYNFCTESNSFTGTLCCTGSDHILGNSPSPPNPHRLIIRPVTKAFPHAMLLSACLY